LHRRGKRQRKRKGENENKIQKGKLTEASAMPFGEGIAKGLKG